jgi:UDP-4-amino-4,6-dideoxy-N-acetyl-beta-L-altrosamine N-acetyltransferase
MQRMKIEFINYTILNSNKHKTLLKVRNAPKIAALMHTQNEIDFNAHLEFVDMLKNANDKIYFAIFVQHKFIGGVSATKMTQSECEWGVFFQTDTNILHSSVAALCFMRYLFEKKGMQTIKASVKKSNTNALSFNKSLGFTQTKQCANEYLLCLQKEDFFSNKRVRSMQKRIERFEIEFKEDDAKTS